MIRIFKYISLVVLLIVPVALFISCGAGKRMHSDMLDGQEDTFYLSTRMLMMDDERKVYRRLPDKEARDEFIREFWMRRDPNPVTPENEFKIEFEKRVEFVDRWFRERVGAATGMDSDRGKIFLVLGEPSERYEDERTEYDRFGTPTRVKRDVWYYDRYKLMLEFRDAKGFGIFLLRNWNPDLLSAMDAARDDIYRGGELTPRQQFTFKAEYSAGNGTINILIPVKDISFEEKDGKMEAAFKVKVRVFMAGKKTDKMETTQTLAADGEDLLKRETVELKVPYRLPETGKGKYSFEVIIEDKGSGSRFKEMFKYES